MIFKRTSDNLDKTQLSGLPPVRLALDRVSLGFKKHKSLFDLLFKKKNKSVFWALKDVSFELFEGDTLGVIGLNGSGKSTLSLVCTQIYPPDTGAVTVRGKVQLLALGVGFKLQMTGRENVFISGSLLGLKKNEIKKKMAEIEAFADIGDFIDQPVRTYSSGMRSRLAFAVATALNPDILILDEVLATGDSSFRKKATERIMDLHSLAKCVIIISHNPNKLRELCNQVMWLDRGQVIMKGEPEAVLSAYQNFCKAPQKWREEHAMVAES